MKSWLSWGLMTLSLASSSCVVAVDHRGDRDSTLTVEWTIDGSSNPDRCNQSNASYAYVLVESRYGVETDLEVDCEDGVVDIVVPDGSYWVTVVLRDRRHDDRTVPAETGVRELYNGYDDYVVLDFPARSFL